MHDDMQPDTLNQAPGGAAHDNEGAMARADLYKLANYSLKLFKKLDDSAQLEAWVQAKITKAADYVASVYHYLEYEMEFSEYGAKLENSGMYNEDQKIAIKNKLMEAKQKMAELKKIQADKLTDKKVQEGVLSGGERPCAECGGTGMVYEEPKAVPDHVKGKVEKYKRLTKAMHAASKRLDKNNNGIPDNLENDEEVEEDLKNVGDTKKSSSGGTITKTATGIKHERDPSSYDDGGDELDSMAKSGKGKKSHAKAQSAAEKKDRAPKQKQSPKSAKTWGMKDGEKFDNRDKTVDETFGQGVYAEGKAKKDYDGDGKVESDKDEVWGSRAKAAAKAGKPFGKDKKVKEGLKGNQHKLDVDDDGDIEGDDLADLRAGKKKKDKKVDEASMWKNKAKSLKENLESLLSLKETEEDVDLTAILQQLQQTDPEGLKQAVSAEETKPGSIAKFIDSKMMGSQASNNTGATMGQEPTGEPKDMPNPGDTEAGEGVVTDFVAGGANAIGQQVGGVVKGVKQAGQELKQFGTDVANAAKAGYNQATGNSYTASAKMGAGVQAMPAPNPTQTSAAPANLAAQSMPGITKQDRNLRESAELDRMKQFLARLNG